MMEPEYMWPSSPASTWALSSSAVTLLDEPIPNNKTDVLPPAAVAWDCGDDDAAAVPSASDERTRRIASIAVISGNWNDKTVVRVDRGRRYELSDCELIYQKIRQRQTRNTYLHAEENGPV